MSGSAPPATAYSPTISTTPVGGNYSANFSTAALEAWEKADVRRFCGYPPYGGAGMSGFWGFRFFQAYGLLEYRMTNLAPYEFQVVRYHLNYLVQLEAAQATASDNLDTNQASVWLHNQNEIRDRAILFDEWRRKLCNAVGIPPGPQLEGAATGRITI